jgi:hypothetical protein
MAEWCKGVRSLIEDKMRSEYQKQKQKT